MADDDPLAKEVNRATKGAVRARRINPLREFNSLGPGWQGPTGTGRTTDEFKRDKAIAASADAADAEDARTNSYAKGGMVKYGSPKHTAPCRDTKTIKCTS